MTISSFHTMIFEIDIFEQLIYVSTWNGYNWLAILNLINRISFFPNLLHSPIYIREKSQRLSKRHGWWKFFYLYCLLGSLHNEQNEQKNYQHNEIYAVQ